jgi:hypothetical protein
MFLVPLAASLAACIYFWLATDMHKGAKLAASAAVLSALALQFTALGEGVHFLVPTLTEVAVGLWGAIYMKMDLA